jgi:hypothetical protein
MKNSKPLKSTELLLCKWLFTREILEMALKMDCKATETYTISSRQMSRKQTLPIGSYIQQKYKLTRLNMYVKKIPDVLWSALVVRV